jgi:hypothetical protein
LYAIARVAMPNSPSPSPTATKPPCAVRGCVQGLSGFMVLAAGALWACMDGVNNAVSLVEADGVALVADILTTQAWGGVSVLNIQVAALHKLQHHVLGMIWMACSNLTQVT